MVSTTWILGVVKPRLSVSLFAFACVYVCLFAHVNVCLRLLAFLLRTHTCTATFFFLSHRLHTVFQSAGWLQLLERHTATKVHVPHSSRFARSIPVCPLCFDTGSPVWSLLRCNLEWKPSKMHFTVWQCRVAFWGCCKRLCLKRLVKWAQRIGIHRQKYAAVTTLVLCCRCMRL
jgi:hypothetical protein